MHAQSDLILPVIQQNINRLKNGFYEISDERRTSLAQLAKFIDSKVETGEMAELVFICTHNSRRSHISQIWAQAAARHYSIPRVMAYSGGTEATAFNPCAVEAMRNLGFLITDTTGGKNPNYVVRYDEQSSSVISFSKKYDDKTNPVRDFAAIMTCSHADDNCPSVPGAGFRIAIPYDDPKDFDGTALQTQKYGERADEIGRDMLYAFSMMKRH